MEPFSLFRFLHTLLQPNTNPPEGAENEPPPIKQEKIQENPPKFNAYEQFVAQHNSRVNRAKKN